MRSAIITQHDAHCICNCIRRNRQFFSFKKALESLICAESLKMNLLFNQKRPDIIAKQSFSGGFLHFPRLKLFFITPT